MGGSPLNGQPNSLGQPGGWAVSLFALVATTECAQKFSDCFQRRGCVSECSVAGWFQAARHIGIGADLDMMSVGPRADYAYPLRPFF
jgi:hypothetical protein